MSCFCDNHTLFFSNLFMKHQLLEIQKFFVHTWYFHGKKIGFIFNYFLNLSLKEVWKNLFHEMSRILLNVNVMLFLRPITEICNRGLICINYTCYVVRFRMLWICLKFTKWLSIYLHYLCVTTNNTLGELFKFKVWQT